MLHLTDLVDHDDLRVARVRGAKGEERALARQCLARSYDVVELVDAGDDSVRRLERSGLRCLDGGTVQEWVAPPAGDYGDARVLQAGGSGDWALLAAGQELIGPEQAYLEAIPGSEFWQLGNFTLLRRVNGDEPLEVTARTLPAELVHEAVTAIRAVAGPGGRVLLPTTQQALLAALAVSGFTPASARSRWLLAPLLTRSVIAVRTQGFCVTPAQVEAYGALSGDMNPLHFDDAFARAHGFKGRITHGMIFNGWLTRLLGTEYPGEGTIYLSSCIKFLAPVYPEVPYTVRISTPAADRDRGTYSILAQLRGKDGDVAALSYNDVLNRGTAVRE